MKQVYLNKYGQDVIREILAETKIPIDGVNIKKPRISHENGMPYINLFSNKDEVKFESKTFDYFNEDTGEIEQRPEYELVAHSIHIPLDIMNNPLASKRWKKIKSCILQKKQNPSQPMKTLDENKEQ